MCDWPTKGEPAPVLGTLAAAVPITAALASATQSNQPLAKPGSWYGVVYPDNTVRVDCVVLALHWDTMDWLVALHDDNELHQFNHFMWALQRWFEDPLADPHLSYQTG